MRLCEVLIIPKIKVNLFSFERVADMGNIPMFGEMAGKIKNIKIKKLVDGGGFVQVLAITVKMGSLSLSTFGWCMSPS